MPRPSSTEFVPVVGRHTFRRILASVAVALMAITGAVVAAAPAQASGETLKGYIRDSATNVGIVSVDVAIINLVNGDRTTVPTGEGGYYHFDSVPIDGDYIMYIDARNVPGANYAAMATGSSCKAVLPTEPFRGLSKSFHLATTSSGMRTPKLLCQAIRLNTMTTFLTSMT